MSVEHWIRAIQQVAFEKIKFEKRRKLKFFELLRANQDKKRKKVETRYPQYLTKSPSFEISGKEWPLHGK